MTSVLFLAAVAAIDLPILLLRDARLGALQVEVQLYILHFFGYNFGFGKSGSAIKPVI